MRISPRDRVSATRMASTIRASSIFEKKESVMAHQLPDAPPPPKDPPPPEKPPPPPPHELPPRDEPPQDEIPPPDPHVEPRLPFEVPVPEYVRDPCPSAIILSTGMMKPGMAKKRMAA